LSKFLDAKKWLERKGKVNALLFKGDKCVN